MPTSGARFDPPVRCLCQSKPAPLEGIPVPGGAPVRLDCRYVVGGRAPLVEAEGERPPRLYPTVEVSGRRLILVVSDLAALPRAALSTPVASLASERDRIIAALDLLFTGY